MWDVELLLQKTNLQNVPKEAVQIYIILSFKKELKATTIASDLSYIIHY